MAPPDWLLGRVLFRLLLAIFARRDRETCTRAYRYSKTGWDELQGDGWRFVRGRGPVPRVNEFLPETSFEAVEQCSGIVPEIDETLERYYVVKLNSLQFCGPPNFNLSFWDGLESLILTLPMILWLRRAFAGSPPVQAVQQAIQLVDDHFGGNPMLGFPHFRFLHAYPGPRGQLERLVAWYSR